VVLGHPENYSPFGVSSSITYNIRSEHLVPEEVFMIRELKKNSPVGISENVRYHKAFAGVYLESETIK
jgi:predicted N-acetyltransferase YhbS